MHPTVFHLTQTCIFFSNQSCGCSSPPSSCFLISFYSTGKVSKDKPIFPERRNMSSESERIWNVNILLHKILTMWLVIEHFFKKKKQNVLLLMDYSYLSMIIYGSWFSREVILWVKVILLSNSFFIVFKSSSFTKWEKLLFFPAPNLLVANYTVWMSFATQIFWA